MPNLSYRTRPAKHVVRKMLCEAFRRLEPFGSVSGYRYVGFGGLYFADFVLLHKELNIANMVSIERKTDQAARFNFNVPFHCVDMRYGESNVQLPALQPGLRTIAWLDNEKKLDQDVLADVRWFTATNPEGSVLVLTVNAHCDPLHEPPGPLQRLRDRFEDQAVIPPALTDGDLTSWGLASVSRRIIHNQIARTLAELNGVRPDPNKLRFRQLFNFHYADDGRMLTFGGIIYEEGNEARYASCGFEQLEFLAPGDAAYLVEVPELTLREVKYLDTRLPGPHFDDPAGGAIPIVHRDRYARVYRYLPHFADADV